MQTVARGPVPRDHTTRAKNARKPTPFLVSTEARRGTGPRPTGNGTFFYRSAGACPPRSHDPRKKRTQTQALSPIEAWRGTGPRPTVKGGGLANRSAGALGCHTRIREGFPAIPRPAQKTHANQSPFPNRGTARDRPSPYGKRRRP